MIKYVNATLLLDLEDATRVQSELVSGATLTIRDNTSTEHSRSITRIEGRFTGSPGKPVAAGMTLHLDAPIVLRDGAPVEILAIRQPKHERVTAAHSTEAMMRQAMWRLEHGGK